MYLLMVILITLIQKCFHWSIPNAVLLKIHRLNWSTNLNKISPWFPNFSYKNANRTVNFDRFFEVLVIQNLWSQVPFMKLSKLWLLSKKKSIFKLCDKMTWKKIFELINLLMSLMLFSCNISNLSIWWAFHLIFF